MALAWPWFGLGLALVWPWFGLGLALVWPWFGPGLVLVWPWFSKRGRGVEPLFAVQRCTGAPLPNGSKPFGVPECLDRSPLLCCALSTSVLPRSFANRPLRGHFSLSGPGGGEGQRCDCLLGCSYSMRCGRCPGRRN